MASKLTTRPLPLVCILIGALALRLWGIGWGLPTATHYFSYHPDESVVLSYAMGMNVFRGQLLPHFYNYGSLHLYLVNFANSLAFMFGGVDIVPKNFAVWFPQWARMYLIGRLLTVGMGVGTVWGVCALGTRLWGKRAGLLTGLILTVMPLHAQHSHWLTVDVPATFWVVLSLLWTARIAPQNPLTPDNRGTGAELPRPAPPLSGAGGGVRAVLLAGLFAGFAAATKYNMALVVLPLIAACLASPELGAKGRARLRTAPLALGLAAAVVGFLIACPGAVLEYPKFAADLHYEAVHISNSNDPTFKDTGNGFVYQIATNLDAGLGLPLLLLALGAVGYAVYRRERGDTLLAAFALPYYVLISLAAVRYARYAIPLLPILALWAGRLLADASRLPRPALRRGAVAVGAVVLLLTLGDAFSLVRQMAAPDPRNQGLAWLNAHLPAPAPVGFAAQPWFQTVPLSPYFALPRPGAWRAQTPPAILQRIAYTGKDWDMALLNSLKPPVIVVSEYDYRDGLRLGNPAVTNFLGILRRDYRPAQVFDGYRNARRDARSGGLPVHALPHDMLYPGPAILIFVRK